MGRQDSYGSVTTRGGVRITRISRKSEAFELNSSEMIDQKAGLR